MSWTKSPLRDILSSVPIFYLFAYELNQQIKTLIDRNDPCC